MKKLRPPIKSSATSFVLTIGDEGGILVYLKEGKVERRLFALTPEPSNVQEFDKLMQQDPDAPIYLLVDMMDQNYVQQTLPPVSALSVDNLIRKRLDRDFAADDIKGAIRLGRDKQGRKDWYFMLIALANTPQLQAWLKLVIERPNRFAGIYLAPVESFCLLDKLSKHICAEESRTAAPWQLLVLHSKVGGFRQVVFKNGKILFTRLTQPIGELVPEVVAGNIEQEAINTIEYLKRLSYSEQDGLDAYVVASQEIKNVIDPKNIKAGHVNIFTPFEVAEVIGLQQAALPGDSFADVILSACFGNTGKRLLKLTTPYARKLDALYGYRMMLKAVAACAVLALVAFTGVSLTEIIPMHQEIALLERTKVNLRSDMNKLELEARKLPDNLQKIIDVIDMYDVAFKTNYNPLKMIARISETLVSGVLIQAIQWNAEDQLQAAAPAADAEGKPDVVAEIDIQFANKSGQAEQFLTVATNYLKRLREGLYDYNMSTPKLPGTLSADETLQASLSNQQETNTVFKEGEPIVVKVTVSGPKKAPPANAASPAAPPP